MFSQFSMDFIELEYSNLEAANRWWTENFDCQRTAHRNCDDPLPGSIALKLPGDEQPSILLVSRAERQKAGYAPPDEHPILFCRKVGKAHHYLTGKGASPGLIEESGGTKHFDIRDPEGNVIEICEEP